MRKPLPPFPFLSQDGRLVACLSENELTLLNTQDRSATRLHLPHEGLHVAFAPRTSLLAVAGYSQVSLLAGQPPYELRATAETPAPLFRLALADEGWLVGAANFDERETNLCSWRGEKLQPSFTGAGEPLGRVAPFQLYLDAPRQRVLLSGRAGYGAYSGGGERFTQLLALSSAGAQVIWRGEGLPFEPDGYVFPLAEGRLGIFQRSSLLELSFSPAATAPQVVLSHPMFTELETLVASPGGNYLAWLWGVGPGDTAHLRTARLTDNAPVGEAAFDNLGYFPSIAIDDEGQTILVFSELPNRILVLALEQGQLFKRAELTVQVSDRETHELS